MDLHAHLRALWNAKWPILGFALLAGLLAAGIQQMVQDETYEAEAVLAVSPGVDGASAEQVGLLASTYLGLAQSPSPNERVAAEGGAIAAAEVAERVAVSREGFNFLAVQAVGETPEAAAELASQFAGALTATVADYHAVELRRTLAPLEAEMAALEEQLATQDADGVPAEVLVRRYDGLTVAMTQQRARTSAGLTLVSPATASPGPSDPSPLGLGVLAALVAGVVGGEIFVGLRRRRGRIPASDAVAEVSQLLGVPVLAALDLDDEAERTGALHAVHRQLRQRGRHPYQVVSVVGERPSPAAGLFAHRLAERTSQEAPALLVDADVTHGELHRRSGLPRSPGMTDLLLGEFRPDQAIVRAAPDGDLWYLPSGREVEDSHELIGHGAVGEIRDAFAEAARGFGNIVIAGPALSPTSNGAIGLFAQSHETLLVVGAASARREELRETAALLRRIGVRPSGVVLLLSKDEQAGSRRRPRPRERPAAESPDQPENATLGRSG